MSAEPTWYPFRFGNPLLRLLCLGSHEWRYPNRFMDMRWCRACGMSQHRGPAVQKENA